MFKAKHAKVRSILNAVELSILKHGNGESRLISLSGGSIIQVHLGHPWRSNWHHNLSQKIGVIISWKGGGVDSVTHKAVVEVTLSFLYQQPHELSLLHLH